MDSQRVHYLSCNSLNKRYKALCRALHGHPHPQLMPAVTTSSVGRRKQQNRQKRPVAASAAPLALPGKQERLAPWARGASVGDERAVGAGVGGAVAHRSHEVRSRVPLSRVWWSRRNAATDTRANHRRVNVVDEQEQERQHAYVRIN